MKHLFTFLVILLSVNLFAQSDRSLVLKSELEKAIDAENYTRANEIQKKLKISEKIEIAIENQDFAQAAILKKQLEAMDGGVNVEHAVSSAEIQLLRKEIDQAVANQEFLKAADLKKKLDQLESTQSTSVDSQSASVNRTQSTSGSAIPLPEFNNQVYLYTEGATELKVLEHSRGREKTKGSGGVSSKFYLMEGTNSSTRVGVNDKYSFVISLASGLKPSQYVRLVKLQTGNIEEGTRSMKYAELSTSAWGESVEEESKEFDVECAFEEISAGVFRITPQKVLSAGGEYSFYVLDIMYAFGVE